MGKLSDLDLQIKELRSCGETISEIANTAGGDVFFPGGRGCAAEGEAESTHP